jgi:beta-galactosidase
MWDAWNEPEQCTPLRKPEIDDLTCYCPHCKKEFILWLKEKYGKIRDLNNVWGRIYLSWDEVELPIESACFNDMIDWRLFMLDVLNKEAERRISTIKKFDRKTPVYLHTVPTLSGVFNQITCSDDYALADKCDVFGGTINGPPVQAVKALSAANGKICYNVESHLMVGCTGIHPKTLEPEKLRREFLSHIGLGLKGFMFWQFHAETLGLESPAWGLTDCDGMETPSLKATSDFIDKTAPFLTQITEYQPPKAETGIITTAANEIFQWCLGEMDNYRENIEAYSNFLYWRNIPFAFIPASRITPDCLNAFTTIILPQSYYMSECETSAIIEWVKNGGMLICEADTAGYNASTGRHEGVLPGCGISEAFGIVQKEISLEKNKKRSTDLTSKKHIPDDVKKAWDGNFDNEMISLKTREEAAHFSGGFRLSYEIAADGEHSVIAYFRNNSAALIEKKIGKGSVIYAGTILGNAIGIEENETAKILGQKILDKISHSPSIKNSNGQFVRIDKIKDMKGDSIFIVISDTGIKNVQWEHSSSLKGLFSGIELKPEDKSIPLNIPENFADIFIENF